MMMMMTILAVVGTEVLVVTVTIRNKMKCELYLEVHGLRTVRFYRKAMCSCFEEFFKAVEWQLVHPGRDE